ncbi:MAG: DUF2752 domain-containing protein [Verrucomicrobiales bacterium]|nr:DUF2752 domain-containing protein [Verrucomicrobiales bacterium]
MGWCKRKPPVIGRARNWICAGLILLGLGAAAIIYAFDPARTWFYPPCMFHALTGLKCAGCGGLRAIHKLLHGEFADALRYNALVVISLPFALLAVARAALLHTAHAQPRQGVPIPLVWLLGGTVLAFGVLRNLPLHQLP